MYRTYLRAGLPILQFRAWNAAILSCTVNGDILHKDSSTLTNVVGENLILDAEFQNFL